MTDSQSDFFSSSSSTCGGGGPEEKLKLQGGETGRNGMGKEEEAEEAEEAEEGRRSPNQSISISIAVQGSRSRRGRKLLPCGATAGGGSDGTL